MIRVLLVEDDEVIARIIQYYLNEAKEYEVTWVKDAESALDAIHAQPDIILLDIMLPKMDGLAFCTQVRQAVYCPIIFISCLDDEDTIVRALEIGGDDYLTKPFTCKVLCARIKANLRRANRESEQPKAYRFPDFTLDVVGHAIIKGEKSIPLAPIEFGILLFLVEHPKQMVTLDQIYEAVWEHPSFGDVRTVVVHLYNIRKKIEPSPSSSRYIKNVRGIGYVFDPSGLEGVRGK